MLIIVLALVIIALGLLVASLAVGYGLFAWLSIGASVLAAIVLVVDVLRRRSGRGEPEGQAEPEPVPEDTADTEATAEPEAAEEAQAPDTAAAEPAAGEATEVLAGPGESGQDSEREDTPGGDEAGETGEIERPATESAATTVLPAAGSDGTAPEPAAAEPDAAGSTESAPAEPESAAPEAAGQEPAEPESAGVAGSGMAESREAASETAGDGGRETGSEQVRDDLDDVEPGEEETDAADLLTVTELEDEVVVIDERPRYHLTACGWLGERDTIPLPVREARDLGFTPCGICGPDRVLAARSRAKRG
ncbi:hypothetical protein [Sciscionella sediminilitoris]|uniref:hypothetical protein n=1 Tax=Sciscionella sediminilitoris TaxID=1445613 RepID=UPI0004DF3CF8|nr:hypothetical protein [Sciscionella sp. SE31]